jgi:hypothetical protein
MEFSYRLRDIGAHKGLIVTTQGFQERAVSVAKAERIGLLVAARGKTIDTWAGDSMQKFEFWIPELALELSADNSSMELIGERIIVCNTKLGVERWHTEALPQLATDEELAFLLPEEEAILDGIRKTLPRSRVEVDRAFGRRPSSNSLGWPKIYDNRDQPVII